MDDYRLTPAAKSDLIQIWNYTLESWSGAQAEKYLLDLQTALETLAANPDLGRHRPEISPGYYSFPVGKHIIFYLRSGSFIDIIAVLHGRMDINKNLL